MRIAKLFTARLSLGLAAACLLPLCASAQSIPNPSFEAESFGSFPGYASGNGGVITGWSSTKPGSVGLNPASGSPFADNGTIPAGTNVAFLQSTAGGTDLSTSISGLTSGNLYRVTFRANARGGQNPALKVSIDGTPVQTSLNFATPAAAWTVTSVNSANPYHYVEFTFTAPAATAGLTILNDAAGDNTVCVDDFSIADAVTTPAPAIVASRWTGDADSGIEGTYRYTHARTFGGAAVNTTVNGVLFTPSFGGNPGAANVFSSTGFGANFGEQTRNITGNSNLVARSFMYGGPNTSITIAGLKPNTTYVASIYGVGWEVGDRSANFSGSAGAGPVNINVDAYNNTNGIVVRYRYTTDALGSPVTINYPQAASAIGSWHTAAMSNREATPGTSVSTWSVAAWNDDATSGVNDGATYAYTHAFNFGSSANATINGVTFLGAAGGNPAGANFSTANFGNVFNNDANNVTGAGGSRTVANDFLYNGFPGALTLTGLAPGTEYMLTLFSVGWEAAGARFIAFQDYSQSGSVFDQDTYGDNNGIRINYVYTAPPSGSITITTNPMVNASFHLYGFANRRTAPETNLAVTSHPQPVYLTATGGTATFTASASGNLPLTYEWRKNGDPIPGQSGSTNLSTTLTLTNVSAADVANYTCAFTGSGGQGTVVSNPARLYLITDRVPGLFDTGMGHNCAVLADGAADPHYVITVNAGGAPLVPATVHDSTIFPIVAGPWVANSGLSKWIAPAANSSGSGGQAADGGAGPGVFVYRTTFDLTGFDLSTVRISGNWATDNSGVDIRVNGVSTGLTNPGQFVAFTPFLLSSSNSNFVNGPNTLEFYVRNEDPAAGYTGLRVEGLEGYGNINPGTAPYIAAQPVDTVIPWGGSSCLSVSAGGSATLTYQWYLGSNPVSGATGPTLVIAADNTAKAGTYTVRVTNGVTTTVSSNAVVSFTGVPFAAGNLTMSLVPGTSGKMKLTTIEAAATGATGTVSFAGLTSSTTTGGGTVSIADGWLVYEPAPGFTGADTISYLIEDSVNTVTGTIAVAVAQGIGQTFNIIGITPEAGGNRVVSLGIPGRNYQVQTSEDLSSWAVLGTQVCPASGVISILDPGPLPPTRFYRTVEAP